MFHERHYIQLQMHFGLPMSKILKLFMIFANENEENSHKGMRTFCCFAWIAWHFLNRVNFFNGYFFVTLRMLLHFFWYLFNTAILVPSYHVETEKVAKVFFLHFCITFFASLLFIEMLFHGLRKRERERKVEQNKS